MSASEFADRLGAAARQPANWVQLLKFGVVGGSGYLINLGVFAFLIGQLLAWQQLNAEYVFEIRWWRLDQIEAATDQRFVPSTLASLLRALATDGPPNAPIDVPV